MSQDRDSIIQAITADPEKAADTFIQLQKEFFVLKRRLEIADPDGETIDMINEATS